MRRTLLAKGARPGLLLAAVLLATLCAFAAVACGTSGESQAGKAPKKGPTALDLVRLSQKATAKAQSAKFSMTMSFPAPVAGGGRMMLASNGAEDFAHREASFVMQMPPLGNVEARAVGAKLYERFPAKIRSRMLPPGRSWIAIDLDKQYQKRYGMSFSDMRGSAASGTPQDQLQYLRSAGSVEKLGQEKVRGVQTTHYRATLDLNKAPAAQKDAKLKEAYAKMKRQLGTSKLPVEVWLDGKGRVRREAMSFLLPDKAKVAGGSTTRNLPKGKMDMLIEFYDFGTPVSVSAPPPDQTVSLSQMMKAQNVPTT